MSAFDQEGSAVDLGVIVIIFVDLAKPFLLSVSMQQIGKALNQPVSLTLE